MTLTPKEFVVLSNRMSDEIRINAECVQFESKFEDDSGAKFFFFNKDRTFCLGFNASAMSRQVQAMKYMRVAVKAIVELEAAK